jgi:SAM-dependent methyltransferase
MKRGEQAVDRRAPADEMQSHRPRNSDAVEAAVPARLTAEDDWSGYKDQLGREHPALARLLSRVLGTGFLKYTESHCEYLIWNVICRAHLADKRGARLLEIGSAPGHHLVRMYRTYQFDVYGLDYSAEGVERNRAVFAQAGIAPENVVHADFFSADVLEQYGEQFDVVISRGFIEHFTDVGDVVQRHFDLAAPHGYIVITVPNYNPGSMYCKWFRLFRKEAIEMHNLELMREQQWRAVFARDDVECLYCGYVGGVDLSMLSASNNSPMRIVTAMGSQVQAVLNGLFRLLFRRRAPVSALLSPQLVFLGRKR